MKNILQKIKALWKRLFRKPEKEKKIELPLATCGVRIADEKEFLANEKAMKSFRAKSGNETYVIPLVFHVLHKGEAYGTGTNISDEQIYSCVNALNEDYSKEPDSRGDGDGASTPFRFMLANKDDDGNPTTGIYRVNGAELSDEYAQDGARANSKGCPESVFKNWSRLNNQRVCNIWVVSEIEGNNGGSGIQGYAYFPTANYVDGIVALYNAVGKRNPNVPYGTVPNINLKSYTSLNRTLTHELGHYFALFHTFQGNSCDETNCEWQGDRVCDTPPTIKNSNGNYPACGGTQQVENYMDYTNEKFKNMFTQGQVDRMVSAATFSRANLLNSDALENLPSLITSCTMGIVSPGNIICKDSEKFLKVNVINTGDNPIHKMKFRYTIGNNTFTKDWYGTIASQGIYGNDIICLEKLDIEGSTIVSVSVTEINGNQASGIKDEKAIIIPTNAPYKITMVKDVIMGQVSWDITRKYDMKIIYESPEYKSFQGGVYEEQEICLPSGTYIFTVQDIVPGFNTEGAYIKLLDPNGNVLCSADGEFSTIQYEFTVSPKNADVNKDGYVNILDASEISRAYGSRFGDENYNVSADLNSDGYVNINDVSIFSEQFQNKK